MITPPPSTDITPRDPQCAADISSFLLPPALTVAAQRPQPDDSSARSFKLGSSKLPPPPMRSRRIIQMLPVLPKPTKTFTKSLSADSAATAAATSAPATRSKRNSNGSTAATRKSARKVAHSAIERRRRSKMNEEFESLKSMVPACRVASQTHGEASLHKLGILQATVEYLSYLEGCVCQLQNRIDILESGGEVDNEASVGETPTDIDEIQRHYEAMEQDSSSDDEDEENEEDACKGNTELEPTSLGMVAVVPSQSVRRVLASTASSYADDAEMEEAGKEVSRTLLMLRQVGDSPVTSFSNNGRGIRVCDLLS